MVYFIKEDMHKFLLDFTLFAKKILSILETFLITQKGQYLNSKEALKPQT